MPLESLIRPKARPLPGVGPPYAPSSPCAAVIADAKPAVEAKKQSAPADGPMVVTGRPNYPRWYAARGNWLNTARSRADWLVLGLTLVFAAGLVLGLLVRLLLG